MDTTESIKLTNSLQAITQTWKDRIICFSPQGVGYSAYLLDPINDKQVNYIHASCDELRHLATNYNLLVGKIKEQYYGYLKEAVLNTVKYEATRRAFRKQHEWIQKSYQSLIEQKKLNALQRSTEIERLNEIVRIQKQEILKIKNEYSEQSAVIQTEDLLKQKEAEIQRKNQEIARLNQQLQKCDREIHTLKFELSNGLSEIKRKYKWLITQFIREHINRQHENKHNKSLQSCQNIFEIAQRKIASLQGDNKLIQQEFELINKVKMLPIESS